MALTLNDTLGVKREMKAHYDFGQPFWDAEADAALADLRF